MRHFKAIMAAVWITLTLIVRWVLNDFSLDWFAQYLRSSWQLRSETLIASILVVLISALVSGGLVYGVYAGARRYTRLGMRSSTGRDLGPSSSKKFELGQKAILLSQDIHEFIRERQLGAPTRAHSAGNERAEYFNSTRAIFATRFGIKLADAFAALRAASISVPHDLVSQGSLRMDEVAFFLAENGHRICTLNAETERRG
jgi:hypothetical protein